MKRIALLSDTHGYLDEAIKKYCGECDEIWHAGDIGTIAVTDELAKIKPVQAVYGNIDGTDVRKVYPEVNRFRCEEVDVLMIHIAGRPERYAANVKAIVENDPPKILVCGHSHLLLVKYEKRYGLLHLNPGAAGRHGFHKKRTMLRFTIAGKDIRDMEVIELS